MLKEYKNYNVEAVRKAVEYCGGLKNMSELLHVHKITVAKWACGMGAPSAESCIKIEKVTKKRVRRNEIREDIDW